MPNRHAAPLTPERNAPILTEALRRIDRAIPDPVDIHALRQALETEMAKGSISLVGLMKVGRRRALDRMRRAAREKSSES